MTPPSRLQDRARRVVDERPWMAGLFAALAALLLAWLFFELGRSSGAGGRRIAQLQAEIRARDALIAELRRSAAELDTIKAGQERERQEVSRTIGELQAQIARQTQDLAFYRGIVVQGANAPEVAIREARIARAVSGDGYVVRITLVQPGRPERTVSGRVSLVVEGLRSGRTARLDLATLTGGSQRQLDFSFRYFENLAAEIRLPGGFEPERLVVEVRSTRREVTPVSRTLLWALEAR